MTTRLAAAAVAACLASAAAAQAPGRWQMVWSDEFGGTAVDRSKWTFAQDCWGGGNKERQCYVDRPANAAVADGILTITARAGETTAAAIPSDQAKRGAAVPVQTKPFSSAKLLTKGKASWTYGRFRIRARLPHGQGTWPAIWMLPDHNRYGPWAASGEIDIMEVVNLGARCPECPGGIEDRLLGTLHFGGPPPANRLKGEEVRTPAILDGAFHVFELVWTPERMVWTVDGKRFAERVRSDWHSTGSAAPGAPFDQPFHLILNLAIGGGLPESRGLKTVDPNALPARFEVDYVRVWQCRPSAASTACAD